MNFTVTEQDNYSVITSHADKVNAAIAPELKSAILNLNKSSVNNIIIDLGHTSYCDSSGLSAILTANRLCKDSSGHFILAGLQPNVKKMIEIAQLDRVLMIREDVDAALSELNP